MKAFGAFAHDMVAIMEEDRAPVAKRCTKRTKSRRRKKAARKARVQEKQKPRVKVPRRKKSERLITSDTLEDLTMVQVLTNIKSRVWSIKDFDDGGLAELTHRANHLRVDLMVDLEKARRRGDKDKIFELRRLPSPEQNRAEVERQRKLTENRGLTDRWLHKMEMRAMRDYNQELYDFYKECVEIFEGEVTSKKHPEDDEPWDDFNEDKYSCWLEQVMVEDWKVITKEEIDAMEVEDHIDINDDESMREWDKQVLRQIDTDTERDISFMSDFEKKAMKRHDAELLQEMAA